MKWTCIDVRQRSSDSNVYSLPKNKRKLIFGDVFKNGKILDSRTDATDGVSNHTAD